MFVAAADGWRISDIHLQRESRGENKLAIKMPMSESLIGISLFSASRVFGRLPGENFTVLVKELPRSLDGEFFDALEQPGR